ncbi:MAG: type III pantothenate kinase [Halorhodospira sp.]
MAEAMHLLLDLGNTSVKWAAATADGSLVRTGRIPYPASGGAAATAEALGRAWPGAVAPVRIDLVSVCDPAWQQCLEARLDALWAVPQHRLRSTAVAAGVRSGYRRPAELGADRWAALIGARHLVAPAGACILDCGTAITVDGIDQEGCHLGGAIFPGPRLLLDALAQGTAALPELAPGVAASVPADSTEAGMVSGVAVGTIGAVHALTEQVLAACLPGARRILTGGGAGCLHEALGPEWEHRPHLVLEGVAAWARWRDTLG